jgi:(2Fe-2S) ferredoxin
MTIREHYIFVCVNRRPPGHPTGSCADKDSGNVLGALKEAFARRGLAKVVARVCGVSCLDMCGNGVAVLVEPEHVVYGGVRPEHADVIADAVLRGELVGSLVVEASNQGIDDSR